VILEHIGIAVKSIEERLKTWKEVLGLELKHITEVPDQKVKVAVLDVGGVHIELLEPLGEGSAIRKFLEKRGEGLHHICIQVDDLEKALSNMKYQNVKLIDEVPCIGASGKKIVFIHPQSVGGVLIELSQK